MGRIIIAGIGPGSKEDITPAVLEAVGKADAIIGYKYYFQFITPHIREDCPCIDTGMKKERDRAAQAFELACQGKTVVVISSGDAGIYGMAPLIYEMNEARRRSGACADDIDIETLPGISAFQKAASLLGAPIGHDLCLIAWALLATLPSAGNLSETPFRRHPHRICPPSRTPRTGGQDDHPWSVQS